MKFHLHPSKIISARLHLVLIPLVLAIVTFSVYWQVHNFAFVSFDDNDYVTANVHVRQGISLDNLFWAFNPSQTDTPTYWQPLTWLSLMLYSQMFGINPGAYHQVNLLIHIINASLLFLTLYLMTGAPWKSAFVAALFALHPINVDSVAWVSERKNLLSTTFWMLTLLSYQSYARKQGAFRYGLTLCSLSLGLLAKPMLVTLPFVLLLLDFWPLGRMDLGQASIKRHSNSGPLFQPVGIPRLVIEKIPFLALSITTIILSMTSLRAINQLAETATAPMTLRIENALVSYGAYLWKMAWPTHLAVFYTFPKIIPLWQSIGAALFLIAVSALVFEQARKSPWLATGWLWYMGTLLPVIGLVQGGLWPALADRWAYVPFIGIFIIIAWVIPELTPHHRLKQALLGGTAAIILCVLSIATWIQAGYWKTSQTLFEHALKVTSGNYVAHINLGIELYHQGRTDEANHHYHQAIEINPDNAEAHNNFGNSLSSQGRKFEAIKHFQRAIEIKPDFAKAYFNLANTLGDVGKNDQAIAYYLQAIAIKPNYEKACNNLATLLLDQGRTDEAITYYRRALTINPSYAQAQYNIGIAYFTKGNIPAAVENFKAALRLNPGARYIRTALHQAMGKK